MGRRSVYSGLGMYGHLGMSNAEVIADRLISIQLVEAPPPGEMTKEHVEAYLKECKGVQLCMPNSEVVQKK